MEIGFIGLGRMGCSLARSLLRNGQPVTVFDIDDRAVSKIVEQGARRAKDVASLCEGADLVFTMLPGPRQVREVALGGLAAGRAGQDTSCLTDFLAGINAVEKIRL